ncbi:hypothetical protein M514_20462 [Trichuris suis]|uniref:Uncharacterized protein n=1 Tax=Trichuris suis TaxID=68888 RepID=A0A085ND80_9BILA|nr:hypothetical protein M514_20462 [Trichuris suis]
MFRGVPIRLNAIINRIREFLKWFLVKVKLLMLKVEHARCKSLMSFALLRSENVYTEHAHWFARLESVEFLTIVSDLDVFQPSISTKLRRVVYHLLNSKPPVKLLVLMVEQARCKSLMSFALLRSENLYTEHADRWNQFLKCFLLNVELLTVKYCKDIVHVTFKVSGGDLSAGVEEHLAFKVLHKYFSEYREAFGNQLFPSSLLGVVQNLRTVQEQSISHLRDNE